MLKVIIISPLPPPAGGIATWSKIVLPYFSKFSDIEIRHFNIAVGWRSSTNHSLIIRVLGGSIQAATELIRLLYVSLTLKPEILHLCTSGSFSTLKGVSFSLLGKIARCKIITHIHHGRLESIINSKSIECFLTRILINLSNHLIVLDSKSKEAILLEFPRKFTSKIANPISIKDIECILNNSQKETPHNSINSIKNIVFCGHVIPSKGIIELFEAYILLNNPNIKLTIIGEFDEELKKYLLNMVPEGFSISNILFTGSIPRNEAVLLMAKATVFTLPSHSEGFPNVILEAMCLGIPIISTAVGAIPEILDKDTDYPCGIIIEPKKTQELFNSLSLLLNNKEYANTIAMRAKVKVAKFFDIEKVSIAYKNVWMDSISPH